MDFGGLPKINVNAKYENKILTYDTNVFAKEYNKVKKIGRVKPKTFLIKCDGDGSMGFTLIEDPIDTIEKLSNLKDSGIITLKEFEQKKKDLLKNI